MMMTFLMLVMAVSGGLFLGTILYSGARAFMDEKCPDER